MERRIFGMETEFGLLFVPRAGDAIPADHLARRLYLQQTKPVHGWTSTFLRNGARFYIDEGDHPEYATPECDSLLQLLAHDKAGERIVEAMAVSLERELASSRRPGSVYVFKNNVDAAGNSYGTHENYLMARACDLSAVADALMPFLVTRQMIAGAGHIVPTTDGATYCFSQRADHMAKTLGSATMHGRAIISTRDMPYADAKEFRRLHVIVGDANMSEPTLLLKTGSMHLLLRMLEEEGALPSIALADPVAALRAVNRDLTGRSPVALADGGHVPALAVQEAYLDAVQGFAAARHLDDPVTRRTLSLWRTTLEAIRDRDFTRIDRDIDWAIKLKLLERYREGRGLPWDSARLARLDLGYHDVSRRRGLYYRLQARGEVNRVVTDIDILDAAVRAPQTTRARLRGEVLRWARENNRAVSADWASLTVTGSPDVTLRLTNPLTAHDARVDAVVRRA